MAKPEKYRKLSRKERQNRYFSDEFKKKKVEEIENNLTSIAEIVREYQVTRAAVYKWLNKFSPYWQKGEKQVVEAESDTRKIKDLKDKVHELEQTVGQKQIMIDFLWQQLEEIEKHYGIEVKKNFSTQPSNGSGSTGKNTPTK